MSKRFEAANTSGNLTVEVRREALRVRAADGCDTAVLNLDGAEAARLRDWLTAALAGPPAPESPRAKYVKVTRDFPVVEWPEPAAGPIKPPVGACGHCAPYSSMCICDKPDIIQDALDAAARRNAAQPAGPLTIHEGMSSRDYVSALLWLKHRIDALEAGPIKPPVGGHPFGCSA